MDLFLFLGLLFLLLRLFSLQLRPNRENMNTLLSLVFCLLCASLSNALMFGSEQRVIVKGRLICGDKPASNVQVKLFDIDTGFDDLMGQMRTNANGEFNIDGKTSEITTIDPMLKIYHNCHDWKPCDRRIRIDIPTSYIGKSGQTPKTLDIGTWNLMQYYKDEDRDCIH